jgi:deoxycytidylate deaminase
MFTDRDHKFFQLARSAANTSCHPKARIGAVVVDKGEVLSVGVNKYGKSHPLQKKYNEHRRFFTYEIPTSHNIHAEMDALLKSRNRNVKGASIYVSRAPYDKHQETGMCRPCGACMEALRDFGIKKIFYTSNQGLVYEEVMVK